MPAGDPLAVRVGPGWLYIAPLDSDEPAGLTAAWPAAWTPLGYTDQGSSFVFESSFEDVVVAEVSLPRFPGQIVSRDHAAGEAA